MNSEPTENPQQIVSNGNEGGSSSNIFGQLFSSAFGAMKWFVGLRWYIILLIVVFGSYLFFQMEYAVESRRQKRNNANKHDENDDELMNKKEGMDKKEGMEEYKVEKMKGILRQSNSEKAKKHVSFHNNEYTHTSLMSQIYNLWILPWIYVLFRNTGIRS